MNKIMGFPSKILRSALNTISNQARDPCSDIAAHIPTLYMLSSIVNGTTVELGAGCSTLALLAGCTQKSRRLVSYDLNPETQNRVLSIADLEKQDSVWKLWTHIVKDSVSAASEWNNHEIALLFIDTLHSLEHTRKELAAWFPKMKSDGIICGHDYYLKNKNCNVQQAVDEFVAQNSRRFTLQVFPYNQGLFVLWPNVLPS